MSEAKAIPPKKKRHARRKKIHWEKRAVYKKNAEEFEALKQKDIAWASQLVARPYVTVQQIDQDEDGESAKAAEQICFPPVFFSPIRPNIVRFVHGNMAKNHRQPYAVFYDAGHQHSAESWGTGRAVSRIPRVSGGGTSRAGQGAFGNMCRSGRMFAPTKTWRKWHVKLNCRKKRYATVSALAASALPAIVEARGHRIQEVPELPLVVDDALESVTKTKQAIAILESLGGMEDVIKVKKTKTLRAGKGKLRNRRYVSRKGPLVVYKEDKGIVRAFRNLPGVELCQVRNLDVIKLAPGGQLGRFIIWTKSAFVELNALWGSWTAGSQRKSGYKLPRPCMTNPDLSRIINSVAVQTKLRAKRKAPGKKKHKKNPLKNLGVMVKLNPYAIAVKRAELLKRETRTKNAPKKTKNLAKLEHEWRKPYNYRRIATESNIVISKEKAAYLKSKRKARSGYGTKLALAKAKKAEEEVKSKAAFRVLKDKAIAFDKERLAHYAKLGLKGSPKPKQILKRPKGTPSLKQIKKMIERHNSGKVNKKRKRHKKNASRTGKTYTPKKKKKKSKGAKVSAKPEEAKPFKTYDNDEVMGKEAPLAAIRKLNYVQGKAPKEGNNVVVLLWRKSYKSGYKFMPLYSALKKKYKNKPVEIVGVCVDRDKNSPAGFIKKYTNGPKGNFTTSFAICEEWAPPNKVRPLKGRNVEKGFMDNMMDLHPGMKEMPSIPHAFIVNSHGTVVWHQDHSQRGAMAPDNMDLMEKQLDLLLSGKPLMSVGSKAVEESESDSASDGDDADGKLGDMGDFFTGL